MDNNKTMDWGKLSPQCITDTWAYKNAKKIFATKTDDFCRNVAALAIIEHTFSEGYVCKLSEIKAIMKEKFGIKKPLKDSSLLSKAFFSERSENEATTNKWLDCLTPGDCEKWQFKDSSFFQTEQEQSKILNLDSEKVQLLKTTIKSKVPMIWEIKVPDVSTGYAYAYSLSKESLIPIWIQTLLNPTVYAPICASGIGKFIPVINMCEFNPKVYGLIFLEVIRFITEMNFQVIIIEHKNNIIQSDLTDCLYNSAIHLTTDIEDPISMNENSFTSMFGRWGTILFDIAKREQADLKKLIAMETPISTLLKNCKEESSARKTIKTLITALSEKKSDEGESENKKQTDIEKQPYTVDVINVSVSPSVLLKMAQNQLANKKCGLKFLFSGPSGTGKTAFAYYLSDELGVGLITAKASDILSRWVGGSEQSTCELFKRAKDEKKILLIDEIDAFLGKRTDADPNIRITATLVNQFLQEIEAFDGIFIGTTNVVNQIDSAFIRRFTKIIDFKYLKEEGIREFLSLYFPDFRFSEKQINELIAQNTVGVGDFGSVYSNIQFLDEAEVTTDYIVKSLLELGTIWEQKRTKSIGFSIC